jgi:hypothetical protein
MQGDGVIEQSVIADQTEVCASCGRAIGRMEQPFIWGDNIVCFGCHRHLSEHRQFQTTGEHTFLSDNKVKVTNRRLSLGRKSFDLAVVRFARMHKTPARRWIGWLLSGAGITVALCGLNRTISESDKRLLAIGASLLVLGMLWALMARATYAIILTVVDSEFVAFRARSHRYAHQLLDAIANAIIERGQASSVDATQPLPGRLIKSD